MDFGSQKSFLVSIDRDIPQFDAFTRDNRQLFGKECIGEWIRIEFKRPPAGSSPRKRPSASVLTNGSRSAELDSKTTRSAGPTAGSPRG